MATFTYSGGSTSQQAPTFALPDFSFNIIPSIKKYEQKGNLVYEYNPFRNFRSGGGSLQDLDTELLNFDLSHPVDIQAQTSYDGSVNLILNDDKNIPRLINSRFSVLENDTYEIVDRNGSNDTNIYDEEQFNVDTSLYKRTTTIPVLEFKGLLPTGALPVGNYTFFFKYIDSDGNETDFIEESGLVTCHLGKLNDPFSIQGGILNENSNKSVEFVMSNIDVNYEYLIVYYIRSTSDETGLELVKGYKIDKNFVIKDTTQKILITGYENTEEVSLDVFNTLYNVSTAVKTQAQCQNMLFFGNINKPDINYKELKDLSLRFLPTVDDTAKIGNVDSVYNDSTGKYEYYNTFNIYNNVGYWNDDIYRLGIVYILKDNTLSPVFDIRGRNNLDLSSPYTTTNVFVDVEKTERNYININEETGLIVGSSYELENAKGIIRLNATSNKIMPIYGIKITTTEEVLTELKKHIKGYFFVRQKRIPTILAQAFVIGGTKHGLPTLKILYDDTYTDNYIETTYHENVDLTQDFTKRFAKVALSEVSPKVALCPEYELKQPLYNNFFIGDKMYVKTTPYQPKFGEIKPQPLVVNKTDVLRSFVVPNYIKVPEVINSNIKIATSHDGNILTKIDDQKYRGVCGNAEEAWRYNGFMSTGGPRKVRGHFGPYLCLNQDESTTKIAQNKIINIYIQDYSENNMVDYFNTRMSDNSPYYSISNRIELNSSITTKTVYRGDCYLCNYTHRMNRNFRDSETPINDEIIDVKTYSSNYRPADRTKINRSDVNCINMGHWVTFKVYSTTNLSMRCTDSTHVDEYAISQKPRHFYPAYPMSASSECNMPESFVMNEGMYSSTSKKPYFLAPDVPAIKNNFATRILYSDIHVTDAFKNGYRTFVLNHYRDYTPNYGGITKLVEYGGNLVCVFEKGTVLIPVNERAVAGEGVGGNVYINTSNVLPQNPNVLSDTFGSQ